MSIRKKIKKEMNSSGIHPCDICHYKTFLHTHHIGGREIPNADFDFNLADVCPNCHNEIHYGRIIIEGWFTTTNGMELLWHKKDESGFTDEKAEPHLFSKKPSK